MTTRIIADSSQITEETPAAQSSHDQFNSFLNAPVTKLDADEYIARDLDGVTESLTGSGNLNFLVMQAGQVNEAARAASPFAAIGDGYGSFYTDAPPAPGGLAGNEADGVATERAPEAASLSRDAAATGTPGGVNATATSLSASNLAANGVPGQPGLGTAGPAGASALPGGSGGNGLNGAPGTSATAAIDGSNGSDGAPGSNGADGNGGNGGTTIINIDNSVREGDVYNIDVIDNTLFETIETIYETTSTTITNIVNHAAPVLTTVVNNAGDIVTNTTNNLFETVEQSGDILTTIVNTAGDTVSTLIENIFNTIDQPGNGGGGSLGPIGLSLDATLDGLTGLDLDIISGPNIIPVLDEVIDTSPLLAPVGGLIGDLMSGTSLDVILDPFQYDAAPDDSDLSLGATLDILDLGLPPLALDIPLDPVEALLGDIDIDLDLDNDLVSAPQEILETLLGGGTEDGDLLLSGLEPLVDGAELGELAELVVNPVEDVAGDIDVGAALGLGLFGTNANEAGAGDTDLTLPVDLDLLDTELAGTVLAVPLDPLESIVGDIDLDLTVAADLLGRAADGLIDGHDGGSAGPAPLAFLGAAASSLAAGLLPASDSADTDVSLTTGLGLLDQTILSGPISLVLNPVENLVGDLDLAGTVGLGLLGSGDDADTAQDVTLPVDLDLAGADSLNDALAMNLDPLEQLVGDIDIDLALAGDILGASADPLIDAQDGGAGAAADVLSQLGVVGGDAVSILLPFDDDAAPDLVIESGLAGADMVPLANTLGIHLDPLEDITGDLDIGTGAILGLGGDDAADLAGLNIGFEDIGILGNALEGAAAIDPLGSLASVGSNTDIFSSLDPTLDPVATVPDGIALLAGDTAGLLSSLTATLTQTIDTAIETIGNAQPSPGGLDLGAITGMAGGGLDTTSGWTEAALPDAGAALGGGLSAAVAAIIPDPVLSSPLSALPAPVAPVIGTATSLLGGFGGFGGGQHHHGGLFG